MMHKWVLSCTKNTSIVLFPNVASMLLSVLTSKSNRGIPNSQHCMDEHWHVVQLFEGFICFKHFSLVSYQKIEDTPYSNQDVDDLVPITSKNGVLPWCIDEYFFTVGVTFTKKCAFQSSSLRYRTKITRDQQCSVEIHGLFCIKTTTFC